METICKYVSWIPDKYFVSLIPDTLRKIVIIIIIKIKYYVQ